MKLGTEFERYDEPGFFTVPQDRCVLASAAGTTISDAAVGRLQSRARSDRQHVAFAATPLGRILPGTSLRAVTELYASGPTGTPDRPASEGAVAMLRPGTEFEITDRLVRWTGAGVLLPDAVAMTADTELTFGPAAPGMRPVLRRGTLVCLATASRLSPRLRTWADRFAADERVYLSVVSQDQELIADSVPAVGIASLRAIAPEVILVDEGEDVAAIDAAVSELRRAVIVTIGDGAGVQAFPPRARLVGRLGRDCDTESAVTAISRWASGPSQRPPEIVSMSVPPARHLVHPDPPVPRRSLKIGVVGTAAERHVSRSVEIEQACLGVPGLEVRRVTADDEGWCDAYYVEGFAGLTPEIIEVATATRAGILLDLFGEDLAFDPLERMDAATRRIVLPLVPTMAIRDRARILHGWEAGILPPMWTGSPASPRSDPKVVVVGGAAVGDESVGAALRAAHEVAGGFVQYVGAPGPTEWVALPPVSPQRVADASVVVVVGSELTDSDILNTLRLVGAHGRPLVVQEDAAIDDLTGPRGVVKAVASDWSTALRAADRLESQEAVALRNWMEAQAGITSIRARVRRLATQAIRMSAP